MKTKARVTTIFSDPYFKEYCFKLWEAHLKWLHEMGFERAFEQWTVQPLLPFASGHEVVDHLNEFVVTRGYVNAHLGLTSSDIVDNIRLMQVRDSMAEVSETVGLLIQRLNERFNHPGAETVGFTHWQPAAPISWGHRCNAWLAPLTWYLATRPMVCAKKFGGPVGDQASLELIVGKDKLNDNPFDWSIFDLEYPNNPYPLQSSDHTQEMQAVNWICAIAAQLHKIALDLRFLASHNLVSIHNGKHHAGSSSMPHKINPYKWEKVCSICRSISTTQQEMWQVQAQNSLERTLDTSWQLKALLKRVFVGVALALDEMMLVDVHINHAETSYMLSHVRNKISTDRDLTRRVLAGESRWSAYNQMLQQSKQ